MKNAGFIGLGIMGIRMAKNLSNGDVQLFVHNRSHEKSRQLTGDNVHHCKSVEEVAMESDVIFTMLSTPEVVSEIAFGPNGFVKSMRNNAIWIDCTTVDTFFSRETASKVQSQNRRFADAPVAGSKIPAEKGELVFLVGANRNDFEEIKPLLELMGKKIVHVGNIGQGTALKTLVNSMLAQEMVIFAETVLLGKKLGLSEDILLDALPNFPVVAPFIKAKAEKIKHADYAVEFPLEWMYKDLHLLYKTAHETEFPQFMANTARELYHAAKMKGLAREDFSAIYRFIEELSQ